MKRALPLLVSALIAAACAQQTLDEGRSRQFNDGWLFSLSATDGAFEPGYDDSGWTAVTLPHDFALTPATDSSEHIGPFSRLSPGTHHTGHVLGGTGWYRKSFTLSPSDEGKVISLAFDGSYMETTVWVNGQEVGSNNNGYTPFTLDITSALLPAGQENLVAVKVDNIGRNSRWYTGSGLYREVHLIVTEPVHVANWGVYVTTPEISADAATVNVEVSVQNDGAADAGTTMEVRLLDACGAVLAKSSRDIQAPATINESFTISSPKLWSLDSPALYTAEVRLSSGDVYSVPFGIRSIEISAEKGFLLNGESVLLRGGCVHHDNGFLGAAAIARAERRRLEILKENGYNAVRCSHNPPSETFLNACDELGLLVIDEFTDMWDIPKNPNDYSRHFWDCWEDDLTRMMLRDRNHPSIIFWSIGNEIPKANHAEGVRIGSMIRDKVKSIDNTRFVTEGVPAFLIHGGWKTAADYFSVLDVCGYNYMAHHYESDHADHPERVMYASESYPANAFSYWKSVERLPYVIGDFVWSAFDYIGEVAVAESHYVESIEGRRLQDIDGIPVDTDPRRIFALMEMFATDTWPQYISWCGDLDIIGQKKPQGLYRDILWDRSVIEMNVHEPIPEGLVEQMSGWGWPRELPTWNWDVAEGTPLDVRVFTKAPSVRLELNGETIGEASVSEASEYIAKFTVPYHPGKLTAIALDSSGQELGRKTLVTTGEPASIRLTTDRESISACPSDLAYILIEALDKDGNVVPNADLAVTLDVSGDCTLAASGNAAIDDMASVNSTVVKLYHGRAQAILRPSGTPSTLTLSATSPIGSARVKVSAR